MIIPQHHSQLTSLFFENLYRNVMRISGSASVLVAIAAMSGMPMDAMASPKVVESSRQSYFAQVDGERLLSLMIEPRKLALDMNPANSVKSETNDFKPARYRFPNANVPRTVLANIKDIYRYDRRRDVPIVSSGGDWVIAEYFKANSHIPTVRFRLLGKRVQRQEQLDASGRVTRIVLIGWASRNTNDDMEQPDHASPPGEHPAWIRVVNVSAGGKKTLVAIAWKAAGGPVSASTDDEPRDADLYFGLPDGTRRWHSMGEFTRAFGIDLQAESLAGKFRR